MTNYLRDKGFAYEYIDSSFRLLLKWKYFTLRKFLAVERSHRKLRPKNGLRKTKSLRNQMSGPAVIIGNGPSSNELLKIDLQQFKMRHTLFCMNFFYSSELAKSLTPDYLFICDSPFWRKDCSEYRDLVNEKQRLGNFMIVQPDNFEDFGSKTLTLKIRKNPLTSFSRNISITSSFAGMPNYTAFYMIATALYLGYSPIYIIGHDFNHYKFMHLDSNGVKLLPHHFYTENPAPWAGRNTVSRILNANLQQINALKLFADKEVFTVGTEPPHDILPFVPLDKFVNF